MHRVRCIALVTVACGRDSDHSPEYGRSRRRSRTPPHCRETLSFERSFRHAAQRVRDSMQAANQGCQGLMRCLKVRRGVGIPAGNSQQHCGKEPCPCGVKLQPLGVAEHFVEVWRIQLRDTRSTVTAVSCRRVWVACAHDFEQQSCRVRKCLVRKGPTRHPAEIAVPNLVFRHLQTPVCSAIRGRCKFSQPGWGSVTACSDRRSLPRPSAPICILDQLCGVEYKSRVYEEWTCHVKGRRRQGLSG